MAGQVKDHGVGALTALISGGAVALIGEIFKNAVTEGLKGGGVAFWLTMIAAALAMIVAYISSYNYSVIFRDYGLDSADDDERAVFDGLRGRLAAGGRFMPIYNDLITRGLDRVDRFFGDDDPAVKTLWPRAFGFKGAKPFWTAPAYDRCLLIALLYPFVILVVVGTVSNGDGITTLFILIGSAILARAVFALGKMVKAKNFRRSVVAIFVGFAFTFAVAIAFAIVFAFAFDGAAAVTGAFAITGAVYLVNVAAHSKGKRGSFLISFSIIYLILCYSCAYANSGMEESRVGTFFLLIFGVLTLVNAPFDWLSVGLTRALLRRGVEAGGFAPVWLALLDLVVATLLIVVLAIVTVFAVDLFEVVGGTKIIDVAGVLGGLADPVRRRETQYWWIYATLFSTLIPSVLNMTVAALSLMRGVPWFHERVAAAMRPGKPMMDIHLSWMPGALALEVMLAAMAGLAFTYWWIFKAVPWLTRPVEWLIPMLRWVAGLV